MKVEFLSSFVSDLKKVSGKMLYSKIKDLNILLEQTGKISDIPHLKKIKGSKIAYRIRIGDYRLGFIMKTIKSN